MEAESVARELGVDLFHVDLAKTVSKYIGETVKNIERVIDAAAGAGAVLFFDEADALFGKRTEPRDAHDRYANIEVAYLLEKIESYPGLVILTTNKSEDIDESFLRRVRFIVEFPMPDHIERSNFWAGVFEVLKDHSSNNS